MASLGVLMLLFSCVYCNEVAVQSRIPMGSVAWCKNNEKNEYRHLLDEIFSGTSVEIINVGDCPDIGEGRLALLITYKDGLKEIFQKKPHQNIHHFFATALRKLSKNVVTHITDIEQWDNLPKTVEYIVIYTHYTDAIEHVLFQQAALSGRIPEDTVVVSVHELDLLPPRVRDEATSSYHIWLIEEYEWNVVHLNTHHLPPEKIREEFINLMSRLKYSAIHTYTGEDPQAVYAESGLDPLLIFHETNDKESVIENIVQPLVKEFRSFYAFVTMDVTKFPNLKEFYKIESNESMPYIIVMDSRYKGGLHLDKESVSYTHERLRNYLKSLVLPEEDREHTNVQFDDEKAFQFDPYTLGVLASEQEETSMLVAFCKKDTPSCNEFYENFNEAIKEALSDYGARLDMFVCVSITESLEEVEKFPVTKFPTVLFRYLGIWEEVTDTTIPNYVNLIKKFGRMIDGGHEEL